MSEKKSKQKAKRMSKGQAIHLRRVKAAERSVKVIVGVKK
jgi:hypothetical protein